MRIKGIEETQLRAAVIVASIVFYERNLKFRREPDQQGNWLHFTLGVENCRKPGAHRAGVSGRRTVAACWHAHRDVMRAIFRIAPDAILHTMLATYRGSAGFEHEFPATGTANAGSIAQPIQRRECCACPTGRYWED
jgi:hypothetical protein